MNVLNTTSSALVRRDALQAVDGFDPGLPSCQDWDLWLKLRSIGTFCIVPEPLVGFFQSGGDRITKNRVAVLGGHARVFYKIRTQIGEFKYFRDVLGYHHLRMAQIYFFDFDQPLRALLRALWALLETRSKQAAWLIKAIVRSIIAQLRSGAAARR
jgi:GT2 family glycosyltransferase